MHVFYAPTAPVNSSLLLSKEESQHCIKVLRHKTGDEVFAVNGLGTRYTCRIKTADPKACELDITDKLTAEMPPYYIHIAIAPTKQPDRIEWFVEKACELGIDEITFLSCDHSVRQKLKIERVEKITISALKQSKNFVKAKVNGLVDFETFLQSLKNYEQTYIAIADQPTQNHLLGKAIPNEKYTLLIGPEGDFSQEEISKALKASIQPVSLGNSILRTETAGLIGCHLFHILNTPFIAADH